MNTIFSHLQAALLAGAVLSAISTAALAAGEAFELEDSLNQTWRHEAVRFPLTPEQEEAALAGRPLLDEEGRPVRYQLVNDGKERQILFQADLAPLSRAAWRFGSGGAQPPESDLRVEETPETIRITNARAGLAIRRKLAEGEGPISGIRLLSGQWAGGSTFAPGAPIASWSVEVVERGPVRTRVVCRGRAGDAGEWELCFTLLAGEPEILVDERFSLPGKWSLGFSDGFHPGNLYYRSYPKGRGAVVTPALAEAAKPGSDVVFEWEPWSSWWLPNAGKWFGCYDGSDFLVFGARDSDVWVAPRTSREAATLHVQAKDGVLSIPFPLGKGERRWLVAALDRSAALADATEKAPGRAPLPQQSVIRQELPLDRIKDETLHWSGDEAHPLLYINAQELRALRESAPEGLVRPTGAITIDSLDTWLPYWLKTNDPEAGKALAAAALDFVQASVNEYFEQTRHYSFGFAPHHSPTMLAAANLGDAILGSGLWSADQEKRFRAQAAFLGYIVTRPDYWSPERGFAANPNMTTMVAAYQVALGCLLRSHPQAKSWVEAGLRELKDNELDTWSDSNGGWLEAPHYAMASYDYIMGCFIMARNCGFADHLHDPKMKRVLEWFAKIIPPPDSRTQGWRHLPPIGNTYRFEPSGEFGNAAFLWKEKDPAFAAQLQWMHRQQGSPTRPGVGGRWPVMAGYRSLFFDETLPEAVPAYGSELFPETGVVLRNRYASGNETMLYLIAGSHYQHYDYDSGSITLWGKGEAIADDFGYHSRAPILEHSMVETPYSSGLNMRIETFAPSPEADYVRGKLEGWTRQILFLKDEDPMGPNYFLITDTMLGAAPATWRLWLTGPNVALEPQAARFSGAGKVDADIVFLQPQAPELTVEPLSRQVYGNGEDGVYKQQTVTLHGLSAKAKTRQFAVVIYPRLKGEAAPKIIPLAEGRGVKVEGGAWTDYLFQSDKAFHFQEGPLEFEGTMGAVRIRGGKGVLSLGGKGRISWQKNTLESEEPARKPW